MFLQVRRVVPLPGFTRAQIKNCDTLVSLTLTICKKKNGFEGGAENKLAWMNQGELRMMMLMTMIGVTSMAMTMMG